MSKTNDALAWVYFNETILQFVEDLRILFPKDPVLVLAYGSLKIYMATKKKTLQQAFQKTLGPYVDKILRNDEDFFMQHSALEYKQDYKRFKDDVRFRNDIELLKEEINLPKKDPDGGSVFCKVVDTLKGKWKDMDPHNKDVIWRYMSQLARLNDACVSNEYKETSAHTP